MTRVKGYSYELFSIFDIMDYLEKKDYELKFVESPSKSIPHKINIVGTDVYIDVTWYNENMKQVMGGLRFEDYPRTENFEKSKKLLELLKRKFGRKDSEIIDRSDITKIKDWGKIKEWLYQQTGIPDAEQF
jgi:hypothetical protein